jgi:hypothetical protein
MTAGTCDRCNTLDAVNSGAFWSILVRGRWKSLHSVRMCALDINDSPQSHGSGALSCSAPGSRSDGVRPACSRHSPRVSRHLWLLRWSGNLNVGMAPGRPADHRSFSCWRVCANIQVLVVRACWQAVNDVAPAFASESASSLPTMPTCAGVQTSRIFHPLWHSSAAATAVVCEYWVLDALP